MICDSQLKIYGLYDPSYKQILSKPDNDYT